MDLLRTSNYADHIRLGAKMVPFAGFEMPVQYQGISQEHHAVRERAGIFDVSHMGEFIVKGPHALGLIQEITSNDAGNLKIGQAQYSTLTNPQGGIIDDLLVYRLGEESYMLVVNASNIEKDWKWIVGQNGIGADLHNISDRTALLAIQGPMALSILQKLTGVDLYTIPYYHFLRGEVSGVPNVIISCTGYTGAGGFELYFDREYASQIWNSLMEVGIPMGLVPAGLGARDTLRLEMGFCLYGNDLDEATNPLEAGLGWITKLNKNFTGSDCLRDVKREGVRRKLMGFKMVGPAIPRAHYGIKNRDGNLIGEVRSGTQSPTLKIGIGMGYIDHPYYLNEGPIFIEIRGVLHEAYLVKPPFLKK